MTRVLVSLAVVAALAATAWAVPADGYQPKAVVTDIPWITYIYAVVAAAATAVVGFKSAKRTHLD